MENSQEVDHSKVQTFSTNFNEMKAQLDPMAPYKLPFTYWYEQKFDLYGTQRTIKIYIPQTINHCDYSIFVAVPSGEDAVTFLTESGWVDIAEKYQKYLIAFEPIDDRWDTSNPLSEIEYMSEAFTLTSDRTYYNLYTGCYYFVGYKDGGRLLQQYIMSNPKVCAGLAVFDGSDISEEYMKEAGSKPYVEPGVRLSEVEVPVWIINEEITDKEKRVIDYWLTANNCEEIVYRTELAEVYRQKNITRTSTTYKQAVSAVQITKRPSNYKDKVYNEKVWTDFLSKRCRYTSVIYGTGLRPYYPLEAVGIQKHELVVDGKKRYWHEYVPSIAVKDPEVKLPLVVIFHGSNQNSDIFPVYTEWYKVAEERGFVAVFPTAYPNLEQGGIAKPLWNSSGNCNDTDDIKFVLEMLQDVQLRKSIDKGKIFASGQSLGSSMAQYMALMLPEVFAASGSTSAPIMEKVDGPELYGGINDEGYQFPEGVKTNYEIPIMLIMGENDFPFFFENDFTNSTVKYWVERNHADLNSPLNYKVGIFNNQVYLNENGIPMVIYALTDGRGHSCLPSEARLLWDEFFCKFIRLEDGTIAYMKDDIS